MNLEQLIQCGRTAGLLAMLTGACSPELRIQNNIAQRTQTAFFSIADKLEQDIPLFTTNNNISTGLANLHRAGAEDLRGYLSLEFTLDEGTRIQGIYKPGEPATPLLIGTFGFLSDTRANAVYNFLQVVEDSPLKDYNMLVLDHPSSAPFYCLNGALGWGGIEEGYILVEVARIMKEKYHPSSVHLLGISMGGTGVIHAAYRGEGIINSAIAFSTVTDFTDVPGNAFRNTEAESAFGPRFFNIQGQLNQEGFHMLWRGFDEFIEKQRICAGKKRIGFRQLDEAYISTSRYRNEARMKIWFEPYLQDHIVSTVPQNISEYLVLSDANIVAQHIQVPLFVVHADDDEVVPAHHYHRFRLAARGNRYVGGEITANGGHWGFSAAYGREWVGCLIKTYIDYWSQPDFIVNQKCL
ncbi:alpha/beta hydrolase [Candidatus Woesearchaeota archaeon]|nr:alpha/beta hydrolase [Candidatus Woesearchaeota archaeon]